MKQTIHFLYINFLKRVLFLFDPEAVHNDMVKFGEEMGEIELIKNIQSFLFAKKSDSLKQTICDIEFASPIGLAAGFDYEARLTQVLPSLGFGFQTVGTITYSAYKGNARPMLGRLPKSRALMVNKGFKNLGSKKTAAKLGKLKFAIPVGISIGRTNSLKLKTQKQSIRDIVQAFKIFENSKVKHSYYELNISCPNLYGDITFYPTKNLDELLTALDKMKLTRPIFVKMPIDKTDREILAMLRVIKKHSPVGVIFGNLQKNRKDKSLIKSEVEKFLVGSFSGKPTYKRSNELISLTYKNFKKRFIIVGCGGVFNADDAYEKIKRGATLVQLITGMIYEGPQLVSQINDDLLLLLRKDGFSNISEAIGTKHKT